MIYKLSAGGRGDSYVHKIVMGLTMITIMITMVLIKISALTIMIMVTIMMAMTMTMMKKGGDDDLDDDNDTAEHVICDGGCYGRCDNGILILVLSSITTYIYGYHSILIVPFCGFWRNAYGDAIGATTGVNISDIVWTADPASEHMQFSRWYCFCWLICIWCSQESVADQELSIGSDHVVNLILPVTGLCGARVKRNAVFCIFGSNPKIPLYPHTNADIDSQNL